jgi:acyl-CoA thioesterase-1
MVTTTMRSRYVRRRVSDTTTASIIDGVPPPRRPPAPRRPPPIRPAPLLVLLAIVGLGAAYWWSGRAPTPPSLDPTRETIVFLGDSITSGHGLPLDAVFPHRVGAALGLRVRNAGISGDVTADGLRRLESDVLAHRPKLVVVELGANDVFQRLPRGQTLENVRAIVRRVREDGAGVLLVHIQMDAFGGDALDGYRAVAREEGAWLVEDFLRGVVPDLTTDGLHPTAEGHARLAARLEPILREILAR